MKKALSVIFASLMVSAMLSGCKNTPPEQESLLSGENQSSVSSKAQDSEKTDDDSQAESADNSDGDDSGEASSEKKESSVSQDSGTEASSAVSQGENIDISDVSVRPADWAAVEWEEYSNQYFTLTIPKGWQVQWQGDANRMEWMATAPDGTVGMYNIDHDYASKDASMMQALGMNMSLQEGTVEEYFKTKYAATTEYFNIQNSCVPANKEFIQSLIPNYPMRDYQTIYATFKDDTVEGEGIYSAAVMESRDVVIRGANYGTWSINCVITQWAPQGQFVSWSPVLAELAASFKYTDYYIQEWRTIAQSLGEPTSSVNDTDPVMEAFEERDKSDTIIQEKRSDMIGEYERVYDNDSGNIYRAYNGFLDDIGDQNKYTPITDSQYAEGYVGWIDKMS